MSEGWQTWQYRLLRHLFLKSLPPDGVKLTELERQATEVSIYPAGSIVRALVLDLLESGSVTFSDSVVRPVLSGEEP